MKKISILLILTFSFNLTFSQVTNYIRKDTLEVVRVDVYGNVISQPARRYRIIETEVGEPKYWEKKRRNQKRWSRASIGIFTLVTVGMFFFVRTN